MGKTVSLISILIIFLNTIGFSQIITDGFNPYTTGDLGSQGGWAPFGPGAQIQVESGTPLNYPGYTGSDGGNYVTIPQGSVAWSYRSFTAQNLTGDFNLWVSFIIRINTNAPNGSYVMTFRDIDNKTDGAMLYITQGSSSSYVNFGVCKLSQIAYSGDYSISNNYLIVMKYAYHSSVRDTMFLWVNPSLSGGEPTVASAVAYDCANNDPNWKTSVNYIDLRPMNGNVGCSIDGFRLANTWQQAPLPVNLESFTSDVRDNNIKLTWVTASEINNKGFEIIRNGKSVGWIDGIGNSNVRHIYTFEDKKLPTGKYNYVLKQIDYNGNFSLIGRQSNLFVKAPGKTSIDAYPNPFNPVTKINYDIPADCFVTLKIYDATGKEVKTLVNDNMQAGRYTIGFNGNSYTSGIYYFKIIAGNSTETKKIILLK